MALASRAIAYGRLRAANFRVLNLRCLHTPSFLRSPPLKQGFTKILRSLCTEAPTQRKKFKLPISLMGLWWFGIMGVPMIAVVGYFQVPTRLRDVDTRYKNPSDRNEPIPDETRQAVKMKGDKVAMTEMEDPDEEKPWQTYGVSKTRYREMQQKNDANIAKIHQIIRNTSKKGPKAWNE